MSDEFCPRCGTARTGSFRFCRACQFDFDALDSVAAPTDTLPPAWSVRQSPAVAPAPAPSSAPATAVPPASAARSGRTLAERVLIGAIVLAVIGAGYLVLSGGKTGSSPLGLDQANLPPAGSIWFGTSFNPSTFEINGARLTTVGTTSGFSFVARLTRTMDASAMAMRISWNGQVVSTTALNAQGRGDVWGFSPGPVFSAGVWKYELTDIGGNTLASGSITAQ